MSNRNETDHSIQEYITLHSEINNRSNAQHMILNINITAIGLLLGVALANADHLLVLIAMPIISTSLGLLYFDHAGHIREIGGYLRLTVEPALKRASPNPSDVFSWEKYVESGIRKSWFSIAVFVVPISIIFVVVPVTATVATAFSIDAPWEWFVWVVGIGLEIAAGVVVALHVLRIDLRGKSRVRSTNVP